MPESTPSNPVVSIELRRRSGSVQRLTGDDAAELWSGIAEAVTIANAYGYHYAGPKLGYVAVPPPENREVVAPVEEESTG